MADFGCDYAVLTVVPQALDAALEIFGVDSENWETRLGTHFPVVLTDATDGGQHVVVIHQADDRSNLPAFDAAYLLLRAWRPRHLIVADIGGGFFGQDEQDRDELKLGDIVVASTVSYYETVKEIKGGKIEERDNPILLPSPGPRGSLRTLPHRVPEWCEAARAKRPGEDRDGVPKILPGQVVSGEKLLSDPDSETVAALVERYPKALALDMESAGVGRAALGLQREEIFAQLTVVRGVSDLIDKSDTDNQQIRDDWKPYAAHLAVHAVANYIRHEPSSKGVLAADGWAPASALAGRRAVTPPVKSTASDIVVRYVAELRAWLKNKALLAPRAFRLALRATELRTTMTAAPEPDAEIERGDLLDLILTDRRVVVYGPSGAGKSVLTREILRQVAAGDDPLVMLVDLKSGWNPEWGALLAEVPDETTVDTSLDALLRASPQKPPAARLRELAAEHEVVLMVDAINEVPADTASRIRDALEQYVRHQDNVRVLVTDRRIDPFYAEFDWTAVDLRGVTDAEARSLVDQAFDEGAYDALEEADRRLLTVPFFLDRALRSGKLHLGSRAQAVEDFLRAAGLSDDELDRLAEIAFAVYDRGETVLEASDLEGLDGDGLRERLTEAEILIDELDGTVFGHQLVHQYLAGRYLGSRPSAWNWSVLDKVTGQTASLDAVPMTIAAIADQMQRDEFLRIVYEWSWRAAILALRETQGTDHAVTEALATAVLAMAAEKRFDPVVGTAQRAEGLLQTVPSAITERMLAAGSAQELYDALGAVDAPGVEWWDRWRDIFARADRERTMDPREIAEIGSEEPLIGWTTANTLRRFDPSPDAPGLLHAIHRSQRREEEGAQVLRWRIAHVLGAWPSPENADFLVEALDDDYVWAVYGAVRSLVEMAARTRDPELRAQIIAGLGDRWPELPPRPRSQIGWTALYRDPGPGWPEAIRPLIKTVLEGTAGQEQERWHLRLKRFDEYAAKHQPPDDRGG